MPEFDICKHFPKVWPEKCDYDYVMLWWGKHFLKNCTENSKCKSEVYKMTFKGIKGHNYILEYAWDIFSEGENWD